MKKIFLMLCFFGALLTASAQEKFIRRYTTVSKSYDTIQKPLNITIVFNENETTDIVVYGLKKEKRFYKIGEVERGKTEGGYEYQYVAYIDAEDGDKVFFQIFDTACRIFIGSEYVEYQQ
jgi:hypothetical protein